MVRLEINKLMAAGQGANDLHSSMVRLEMRFPMLLWCFLLYLHSSMVRLEIFTLNKTSPFQLLFTFQYG